MSIKDTFYGFTPLALATSPAQKKKPEHTEIAKLLIQKGAPGKEEALADASESGDAALVKVILDSGGFHAGILTDALELARSGEASRHGGDAGTGGREAVPGLQDRCGDAREHSPAPTRPRRQRADGCAGRRPRCTLGQPAAPPAQRITLVATGDPRVQGDRPAGDVTFEIGG